MDLWLNGFQGEKGTLLDKFPPRSPKSVEILWKQTEASQNRIPFKIVYA